MKKLVLPTLLAGYAYAIILFVGVAACQGGTVAASSFGFGATLGVLLHLLDIPRMGSKALSAGYFLMVALFAGAAILGLMSLQLVWPSVKFSGQTDFAWALLGCVATTVVIAIGRKCCKSRKPSATAEDRKEAP
jgi:hypothetical protein